MRQILVLLVLLLVGPVLGQGPKETDNAAGRLDGHYLATSVKVTAPDKDPVIWKDVRITLEQTWITMQPKEGYAVKARISSIFDFGYKVEIDLHKEDTRYQVLIERAK